MGVELRSAETAFETCEQQKASLLQQLTLLKADANAQQVNT